MVLDIKIVFVRAFDFKIFSATSKEYYNDFPKFNYKHQLTNTDRFEYECSIAFYVHQYKNNSGSSIKTETKFIILSDESLNPPFDLSYIKIISDLMYTAWCYTVLLTKIECSLSIFKDEFLSKYSIGDFYDALKETHNLSD